MPINTKPDSTPTKAEAAALALLLGRLRRMESDNPVYREMLAVAEAKVIERNRNAGLG